MSPTKTVSVAAALSAFKLALHLILSGRYGYNGDELYFIACGRHPAFGYVDHAPLVPWIARASSLGFGDSLMALRFPSALAGALAVFLTVVLVGEFGGQRFAELVAGLSMLIAPAYLRMGSILCIPVFEPVFWTLCAYLIVLAIRREQPRLWLLVGAVAGIGLLNKHTMLFWGVGLVGGLLLTQQRRLLLHRWPWFGGLLAFLFFVPNIVWQVRHGWPTLEFVRAIADDQLVAVPRPLFVLGQVVYMHPITLPVTVAGLFFFFSRRGAPYRMFGWIYALVFLFLLSNHGKPYYLAPAYPVVFAGGAVSIEGWLSSYQRRGARRLVLGSLILGGAALAPISLPLLPLATTDALIQRVLGPVLHSPADLTLELHEEFGWLEQAEVVANVYRGLSPDEQPVTSILTHDYTQASAINFFGPSLGLPRAVSGHMTYFLRGPDEDRGHVVISYGMKDSTLRNLFADVRPVATISHPLASVWQQRLPVYVCKQPIRPLKDAWPELKRYRFRDRATN